MFYKKYARQAKIALFLKNNFFSTSYSSPIPQIGLLFEISIMMDENCSRKKSQVYTVYYIVAWI